MKDIILMLFIDIFLYLSVDFTSFALETNIYSFSHPIIIISIIISLTAQFVFRFKKRYIFAERFILSLPAFIFLSHYKGINIMGGTIIILSAVINCIPAVFLNKAGNKVFCKSSRKKSALAMTAVFMLCTASVSAVGSYNQSKNYIRTTAVIRGYNYAGIYSYYADYEDPYGITHNEVTMQCPDIYEDTDFPVFRKESKIKAVYPVINKSRYEYMKLYINYSFFTVLSSALAVLCIIFLIKESA